MASFDRDISAYELLILQNYTSLSSYYGIPEIISAIVAIMGNKYEADYNLQFLQSIKEAGIEPYSKLSKSIKKAKQGKDC